jgi:outer membrane protein insertion porin family
LRVTADAVRQKVLTGGLISLFLAAGLAFSPSTQRGQQPPAAAGSGASAASSSQGSAPSAASGSQQAASSAGHQAGASPSNPASGPASQAAPAASAPSETQSGQQPSQQPPAQQPSPPPSTPASPAEQQPAQQPAQPGQNPPANQNPAPSQNPPPGQIQLEAPPTAPAPAKPAETKPPAEQAPAGQPQPVPNVIQQIQFRGNRRYSSTSLRARIFSHDGDPYDENALERDFMALWNTGFFDDIREEVSDGARGKIITFFVREKKVIRSIDYKGLSTVTTSDVLDEFRERKVGMSIESPYDPVVVRRAEVVLQGLLSAHGRQFATVRHRTRNIPPNSVALTFVVVEGPKVKVGTIQFKGNTVFSNDRLVRAMKYSKPAGLPPWFYWFHKTYDHDKILADLQQVHDLYAEHGYINAQPSFDFTTKTVETTRPAYLFFMGKGKGRRVDVTIPIDEGPQYRLGHFAIRGDKVFKHDRLVAGFPMKEGEVFNMTRFRSSLENYKKLYGQFGYINFVADPNFEPDRRHHLVNLTLNFDEGDQYFVHRIEFTGNNKTRDKVIRREILLDEGNLFSTVLWDLSILRINQLGYFDIIKNEEQEKGYDLTQNNQNHTVDILLKLKEKGKNSIGFSGGVSGIAGNFIGINYATNNLFGLGETFSLEAQVGTYQKIYSLGFTKPYVFDRPITAGFTIFDTHYHFDQLRQLAISQNVNPNAIEQSPFASQYFQNFEQNSTGFSVFATTPLRRGFGRFGLTYSYTDSSIQTYSAASQQFYASLNFGQFNGPNQLTGIKQSQISPNYTYNTLNAALDPTRGKSIAATLQFAGGPLGGNVNTVRPLLEYKYFHPVNHRRNTIGFHFLASTIVGYGGKVPPPYSRFYMGGDQDIRGFSPYTIGPVGFFPTIGQVCNRDAKGNPIVSIGTTGSPVAGSCGSFTQFPYYTVQFPGGDTELLGNFQYRVPIAGPVAIAYFVDIGTAFILWPGQLQFAPTALSNIKLQFPDFPVPNALKPAAEDNFRPRSSTGLELQVFMPVVHAPFRIYYGYNWLRLDDVEITPPQNLPPMSMFPNEATYNQVYRYFAPIRIKEQKGMLGFTVARQF